MVIKINGEEREFGDGVTVEGILSSLGIGKEGMAVELNREVLPRGLYARTVLRQGDTIEVIRMAGGG